jgi:hypothetical protein
MRVRDRKKRKRAHPSKDSKSRRHYRTALKCNFCNLAVTNGRRLAAHFRQCLQARSREIHSVAAADVSDTARDDSETSESGSATEYLTRGPTWDFCACCDGSTTHCEPCLHAQTGTEAFDTSRLLLLSHYVSF